MLVLGITDGITCGAAVVRDGVVLAATNDERLSRLKMAYGFPRQSIPEVMRMAGVSPSEIDLVASASRNNHLYNGLRPFDGWFTKDKGFVRNAVFETAGRFSYLVDRIPGLEALYYQSRWPFFAARRKGIRRILREEFGITAPVEFVDHHLCHALSAYFTSGFDQATVVSMDGGGDGASSKIYVVRDGHFEQIGFTSSFNSLANYYAYITHVCGFKAQKHEGKITGLAAHGRPIYRDLLHSLITLRDGQFRNVGGRVFRAAVRQIQKRLPAGWTREDVAASIQQHCEDLAVQYVRGHLGPGRPRNLAIAGGLFANVRINQKVSEIEGVQNTWVHPGMTDCGVGLGAALLPCMRNWTGQRMEWNREVIRDVYLGEEYSPREIENALEDKGLSYTRPASLESDVARLLADGHVVARFDGRMEYGPRALGNRTIMYQPADRSVNDWLNQRLRRTEFMPFAPSTLWEYAGQHYHNWQPARESARFMTITYDCTDWTKQTCPGVVHIDGTARPQLVRKEDNLRYWKVIDEFRKLTGVATIINTSFNMHEEPIVCSPQDAVRAFCQGHLDYLVIGDYLVKSPTPIDRRLQPMKREKGTVPV
ncbi:MAG: carbamoyltransferase [Phycisphaerae bacterium]